MKRSFRPVLGLTLLVAALSLASCSNTPPPAGSASTTSTSGLKLATLQIGPSVTRAALQAAVPQASIISFDSQAGTAILGIPDPNGTLQASSLGGLGLLDAFLSALEPDYMMDIQGTSEAMGTTSWAGGLTTWAGGTVSWAGSLGFLSTTSQQQVQSYWNSINLPVAQQLVPELGAGVKVAVVDTGVDVNHPLLKNNLDLVNSYDFVDNDANPAEVNSNSSVSKYGHGTAVAGVVLQMAPKASIMVMRALQPNGNGPTSTIVKAIDKAVANGAKIINLSLGSNSNSAALNTSIANALAKGVLVVASAGNEGKSSMLYPAAGTKTTQFSVSSGLLSVGSVNSSFKKSSFSNYSANMVLNAPGENIITAFPDNRLVAASGTSFSAPAVSGALALLASTKIPTKQDLADNVRWMVSSNNDTTYKNLMGTGTLNVGNFAGVFR